jgi:hypothetical protein
MKFYPFKKKQDTFDFEVTRICKVCSTTFHGRYCNMCGEKVSEPYERSFLNFLDSLLNAFTFLDGKFIKSLKLLLIRPGQLSRNIADGLRVPYMKMVSLFFVANFFYFLFPVFDSYNSSLYTQLNSLGNHSIRAKEIVKQKIEKEGISIQDFQRDYRDQSTNLSKLLIILLVFAFTLCLSIINYSKNTFFFDHLLFSLEFYSFHLLVDLVILANLFRGLISLGNVWSFDWSFLASDNFFSTVTATTLFYFLARGQRIFYGQKWYWVVPKTIILILMLQVTIVLYRRMLFYVTMWML